MIFSDVKMLSALCVILAVQVAVAYIQDIHNNQDNSSSPQLTPHVKLTFGDMALTPLQRYVLKEKKHTFNAIPDPTRRWKDAIIPYKIDCSIEHLDEAVDAIHKAMVQWEAKTCIRFVKHTNQKFHLTFIRDTHCWGHVGQLSYSKISVGHGCEYEFVMAHEIGHAVGLYHEHNRPDRDQWVKVHWENIGGFSDAFAIQTVSESFGVPYDYESIMHYPWNAFSANGRVTMTPKKPLRGKVPYIAISKDDIRLVSRMYNCPAIERKRRRQNKIRRQEIRIEKRQHDDNECFDHHPSCRTWRDWGHCKYESVRLACPLSCNACPRPTPKVFSTVTIPPITWQPPVTKVFKWTDTWPNRNYLGIGRLCIDYNKECASWAKHGSCATNPGYMLRRCMRSCRKLHFDVKCDLRKTLPAGECNSPLGLGENNDGSRSLPNSAFSSSDYLTVGGGWTAPASAARLYNIDDFDKKEIGAWCSTDNKEVKRYVQVDLGKTKTIKYIATQGRPTYYERVSEFKIEYSDTPHRRDFRTYQENGKDKVFYGNCDHRSPVLNRFRNAISARYIRYIPSKWNYPCVRMELFGC